MELVDLPAFGRRPDWCGTNTHGLGHMSRLHALVANTRSDESATMHSQTSVTVGHEDLLGCEDGNLHNAPEVFAISTNCHQRPGRVHLKVVPNPAAPAEAGPSSRDSSEHEDLLRLRAAATHDLARLWSPLEERYKASDSAVREDLIITFVSDHEKDLQAIRSRIESIDSQLDAKGWGTGR